MIDSQDFLVTREVALRTGEIEYKYRTADGRFIVDARTLSRITFTSDEIINGLAGVESISHSEALTLIARNGYKMGDSEESTIPEDAPVEEEVQTEEEPVEEETTENENTEE